MKAFQLKIMIKKSKPPIWRRVIIPAGITFSQLGIILNEVMGWSGYHLFQFEFYKDKLIFIEGADEYANNSWEYDYIDANTTYIREYLEENKTFTYIYDFGDHWRHGVTVEDIIDDYEFDYPQVIKYKGDCPIEDCGGIDGYYECLDIISNPDNEEYEARLEWMKDQGYPNEYNVEFVNIDLKQQFSYIWGKGEKRTHDKIYMEILSGKYGLKATKKDANKNIKIYQSKRNYLRDNMDLIRKVLDGKTNIPTRETYSLKKIFSDFSKQELLIILENKNLAKGFNLSKERILDKLINYLLDIDTARQYFMFQSDYVIDLLNKQDELDDTQILLIDIVDELEELFSAGYAAVTIDERCSITPDVIRLYKRIADNDFLVKRKKSRTILECLRATGVLYGIVPMDVFMQTLNKYSDTLITENEVKQIIMYIPPEHAIFKIKGNKIYKREFWDDDHGLIETQEDKEFYIPTNKEIHELGNYACLKEKYKNKLMSYMINRMYVEEEIAKLACNQIQMHIIAGFGMDVVFGILEGNGILVENEKMLNTLFGIINDMWNNTRMIIHRGHTPTEMLRYEKLQPLEKKEINIDNVISFEKAKNKVYPNSKCPCGSGKKYKFCCGRK